MNLVIYASTTVIFIEFVGRLMLAEVIALLSLPFINIRRLFNKYKLLNFVVTCLISLLLFQILSDIVNESLPVDFIKGWAVILVSLLSIIFLVDNLSKSYNGIIYYLFAIMIARMLFSEGELDIEIMKYDTNYFKVRFSRFLNPAVMLIGCYFFLKKKITTASLIFFSYGVLSVGLDARSTGLIFILSSFLLLAKNLKIRFTSRRLIILGLLVLFVAYGLYVIYINQVLYNDAGGYNARTQIEMMGNPYNPLQLLYYGRPEISVLFQAGLDKPIFGYGSWGKDPENYYSEMIYLITGRYSEYSAGYIRAHSLAIGYWAYAGIGGLIAILLLFLKLFSVVFEIYRSKYYPSTLPILLALTISMAWDLLFSPIGHLRTEFPLFASLVIVEYERWNTARHQSKNALRLARNKI